MSIYRKSYDPTFNINENFEEGNEFVSDWDDNNWDNMNNSGQKIKQIPKYKPKPMNKTQRIARTCMQCGKFAIDSIGVNFLCPNRHNWHFCLVHKKRVENQMRSKHIPLNECTCGIGDKTSTNQYVKSFYTEEEKKVNVFGDPISVNKPIFGDYHTNHNHNNDDTIIEYDIMNNSINGNKI